MFTDNSTREAKVLFSYFKQGEVLTYKRGRRLSADDLLGKIIYVKSGYLAASLATQTLRNRAKAYYSFGPGDIMQARLLISDEPQELTYTVLTNAILYSVSKDDLWREVHENCDLSIAFVCEALLENDLLIRRIETLSYRYASDKLICRILNLGERFGMAKHGEVYIRIPVTHRQLGAFINMARESVSREMEKLASRDLITYERQHITIRNPAGLVAAMHESSRTDWHKFLSTVEASKLKT